jgi:hypothetical protein
MAYSFNYLEELTGSTALELALTAAESAVNSINAIDAPNGSFDTQHFATGVARDPVTKFSRDEQVLYNQTDDTCGYSGAELPGLTDRAVVGTSVASGTPSGDTATLPLSWTPSTDKENALLLLANVEIRRGVWPDDSTTFCAHISWQVEVDSVWQTVGYTARVVSLPDRTVPGETPTPTQLVDLASHDILFGSNALVSTGTVTGARVVISIVNGNATSTLRIGDWNASVVKLVCEEVP